MKYVPLALLLTSFSTLAAAAAEPVHVEMISRPNGVTEHWTLRGINGRKLLCPDTQSYARTCQVDQVVAPTDCDWECQDGVLSGQGRSVFLGRFDLESARPIFRIEAAWDTWQNQEIRGTLYRITPSDPGFSLLKIDRQTKARTLTKLDFSQADDVNFQMDPARADDMLAGTQGLLVTGQLQGTIFRIDQIWRQWSPRLTCDVWAAAKARAFPAGTDDLTLIFGSEVEATTYQDPEGRSFRWLIWERDEEGAVIFRSGINDLWAEVFAVSRKGCAISTLAEH